MTPPESNVSSELSRDLSLFHITMMGLGMMIGAGVFLGMGTAIGIAGPGGAVLTFALGGVIAVFTAMSYAELSSAIPHAGGAYNYALVGFGRGPSFVAGWMEWFASSVAGSLYAVCFATYTMRLLTGLGLVQLTPGAEKLAVRLVTVGIAALFIYINYRGASETGRIGAVMTLCQTIFLAFIGVAGVVTVLRDPSRLQNFQPMLNAQNGGWHAILITMGFTAVAFEGYEVIAQAGDETVSPRQNMPKAMLYSVFVVTITYVAVAFATVVAVKADGLGMAPWEWIGQHQEQGFGAAVETLFGNARLGKFLVTLAVIFASTSALNATIYSATRASYALGRDRMLPGYFAHLSRKRKTPWVALLFTGIIVLVVGTCMNTKQVAASASIMFLLLFLMVNLCAIQIRRNMADELEYGFLMPFFPIFPILAIVAQVALVFSLHHIGITALIIAPTWVGAGILIYFFYSRSRAISSPSDIQILEEQVAEEGDEYRIMLAVADLGSALSMTRTTYALCGASNARVELVHMVTVPEQVSLTDAHRHILEGKEAITETMLYLEPLFPISSTIRYCRHVGRGIVSATRERRPDLLILGWDGKPSNRIFNLGSTLDPVIERCPCDVLILKDCGDRKFKKVLVPLAGGPNGILALRTACMLASQYDGSVTAFAVGTGEKRFRFNLEDFISTNMDALPIADNKLEMKVVRDPQVVPAILKELHDPAQGYDLMIIGYTREPLLRKVARHSTPHSLAELCDKPLIMAHVTTGLKSWVRRWI